MTAAVSAPPPAPAPVAARPVAAPLLSLAGVSARERGAPRTWSLFRRGAPPAPITALVDVRLERGPGVFAILGATEDGARVLVDVLAGHFKPERGKVLVGGVEPHRSAAARARIGVLSPTPELAPGKTVLASVARALGIAGSAAGGTSAARELLAAFGLGDLAERALPSLSNGEARGIELALALAVPSPALVVLHDPFVDVGGISERAVRAKIAALAVAAPIAVVTASPADADSLGATDVFTLHRGALARRGESAGALGAFERTELHVWVGANGRELARALADAKAIRGVAWEATGEETAVLRIAGADRSAVALALVDAAVATNADIAGFTEVPPALGEIRATTEWTRHAQHSAAQAAYRDAYAAYARQIQEQQAARHAQYMEQQRQLAMRAQAAQGAPLFARGPQQAQQLPPPSGPAPQGWSGGWAPPPTSQRPEMSVEEQEARYGPKPPAAAPPEMVAPPETVAATASVPPPAPSAPPAASPVPASAPHPAAPATGGTSSPSTPPKGEGS